MGLMDKFKNLFTDEEVIEDDDFEEQEEIKIKEIKKEDEMPKLPTFMREKIEKEETERKVVTSKSDSDNGETNDIIRGINLESLENNKIDSMNNEIVKEKDIEVSKTREFKFSLNDYTDVEEPKVTRSRQNQRKYNEIESDEKKESIAVKKHVNSEKSDIVENKRTNVREFSEDDVKEKKNLNLYKGKKKETTQRKFKATPIISPIYGILDKNYNSNDVVANETNNFDEKRHSRNVDFDSVRKKAYGSISKEIKENLMCENCEYMKEVKECHNKNNSSCEVNDGLREDIISDNYNDESVDDNYYTEERMQNITLDEACENYFDYGVSYEPKKELPRNDNKKKEIPPVKSSINLLSTLKKSMGEEELEKKQEVEKKLELTDDLFNLIDSMYDERND